MHMILLNINDYEV